MNVSLPEAMEEFVRQKVAIGDYETASEVVREGLRLLKQRTEFGKPLERVQHASGTDSSRCATHGESAPGRTMDDSDILS